jgi:hypothetical protein
MTLTTTALHRFLPLSTASCEFLAAPRTKGENDALTDISPPLCAIMTSCGTRLQQEWKLLQSTDTDSD